VGLHGASAFDDATLGERKTTGSAKTDKSIGSAVLHQVRSVLGGAPHRHLGPLVEAKSAQSEIMLQIPIEAGRVFRRDAGQRSDMKPATIPN